jgi:hypothetical protein
MSTIELIPALNNTSSPSVTRPSVRRYLPYLIFVLCTSLYFIPFIQLLLRGFNEGTLDYGALRILHGQLLGRDFFEVIGPGSFYWLALFFKLFGVTFLASRLCLLVSSLVTALCMYILARRTCRRYQLLPCILLFATYFGTLWPEVNYHVDSNAFALLAVVCMVLWGNLRKSWLLMSAGALAGATTLILQPKGILLLAAFFLWLGLLYWRQSASLRTLLWVISGYVGVVVSMLGYFWSRGALDDLIYANIIWPSQNYAAVNTVPYAFGILSRFHQWTTSVHGINWTIGMAAILVIPFFFVAALPAILLCLSIKHGIRNAGPDILVYWLAGSALWLSELHRKDIAHLVFGSPLLIILGIFYLQDTQGKSFRLALEALSISSVCLAGASLIVALVAQPMQTRMGRVHVTAYDPVPAAIEEHVPPGGDIFIYPYPPIYYFLSATTNPTRYSLLVYNYNSTSQFDEVIRSLEQRKVKYVLWDKKLEEKLLPNLLPSKQPKQLVIEPYLESNYTSIWAQDDILLMERKN